MLRVPVAGQDGGIGGRLNPVHPPITYFGGKSKLAAEIIAAFPHHRRYVEVCGGSLAVLLAKPQSHEEVVNDLDHRLQTFWRVLRDQPGELERVCTLTPHSRAERELAWEITPDLPDLEVARRVWIALTQGRAGSLTRTGWRHDTGSPRPPSMPVRLQRYAGRFAPAAARLSEVSLESRPAIEMVRAYGGDRTTLLYVDPPYDAERSRSYAVDMSRAEHRELAEACRDADAAVVVSGYSGAVWDEVLSGWYRTEMRSYTTQGSGAERGRVEVLWSNRDTSPATPSRDETRSRCPACTAIIRQPATGRRRRWCSAACRQRGYRAGDGQT